jgi:hypothetical protein
VSSQCKLRLDPRFERRQSQFLQPLDLDTSKGLECQVCQRRAMPEGKSLLERDKRGCRLALREFRAPTREQDFEHADVYLLRLQPEQIATRPGQKRRVGLAVCAQRLAKSRNVDLEVVRRTRRCTAAPQVVDQLVTRNELVRMQQQDGQKRPLLCAPERKNPTPAATSSGPRSRNRSSAISYPTTVARSRAHDHTAN